jgi:hypothetical protein
LESDSAGALLQDNSKQTEVVASEPPKDIGFCLANQLSF